VATYLYRLGRFAARRAWAVVLAWILLLGLVAGAALSFGKPFTSKMTIPGTEFQTVLDDLTQAVPKAAGGIGTVVFKTKDGTPFSDAQKKAVAVVATDWESIPDVESALDPFATQQQMDQARKQVADGKAQLGTGTRQIADNEKKIADGKAQLAAGQKELDANAAKLADGEKQLAAGEAQWLAGKQQYDAGAAKLADGRRQLAAGEAKLASGQQQYDASVAQLAAGQTQITQGYAQVDQGLAAAGLTRATLPGAVAALQQQVPALQGAYDEALTAYGPDAPETIEARTALQTAQANLTQLQTAQTTLATLAQKQAQVTAGQQQLPAAKAQLDAARAQVSAARTQVASGQRDLAAAKAKVDAGRAQLDASAAQLADGKAKLAAGRTKLAQAQAELAAGEKQLADAKAKLPGSQQDLTRAERRLALMEGLRSVTTRGDVAVSQVIFKEGSYSVPKAAKEAIPVKGAALADAGVVVEYSKEVVQELKFIGPGEIIGVVVAGIVLVGMLGSLLAAGLPLLTALIGVAVGLLGAVAMTHFIEMTDVTPALALMLGLAVGIDYSLFLVNRHREQLARGVPLVESIGRATGTAGSAVVFAGLTVIVALSALQITGIPFLGIMGFVAAATVAVAVLIAVTLTPALLGLLRERVLSPKARTALAAKLAAEEAEADSEDARAAEATRARGGAGGGSGAGSGAGGSGGTSLHGGAHHEGRGHGWGGLVTRHHWVTMALATVLLAIMAIPAASLRLGLPDGSYEPHDSTAYRTYAAIDQHFGPGRNGPILAVAKVDEAKAAGLDEGKQTDLDLALGEQFKAVPGVAYVVPVGHSDDRRTTVFQVAPTTGPSDEATTALVRDLRERVPAIKDATGVASIGYSGQTVANIDISAALRDALPAYLLVVVGISLVLLLLVFRSVVVPLLATGGFLLSVAAAFGAVVAVYQWGWAGALFGVEQTGLVLSFLPTLVIGILFGLAMDYQMFLVSGMREAWAHGHTAKTAVRSGFSHGARVVTAAALIMTAVFGSFARAELTMVRPIGFALAVGVLIDAFVVRMTAMPAIMHILGERAWYLPAWLDRILPDLDVEGTKLEQARAAESGAVDAAGSDGTSGVGSASDGTSGGASSSDATSANATASDRTSAGGAGPAGTSAGGGPAALDVPGDHPWPDTRPQPAAPTT
jgi:RND superfamily putative drug exporter